MTCDCRSHNGFLTAKGLGEAAQRDLEFEDFYEVGLAPGDRPVYLDKVRSVSALVVVEDDFDYDENHPELNS